MIVLGASKQIMHKLSSSSSGVGVTVVVVVVVVVGGVASFASSSEER